jgi:hypothetical protein
MRDVIDKLDSLAETYEKLEMELLIILVKTEDDPEVWNKVSNIFDKNRNLLIEVEKLANELENRLGIDKS